MDTVEKIIVLAAECLRFGSICFVGAIFLGFLVSALDAVMDL